MEYTIEEYYTPGEDFYTFSDEYEPEIYDNPYRKWPVDNDRQNRLDPAD